MLINVWPFLMTPKSTNLAKTPPKNCTETSKKPSRQLNREHGSSRLYWWSRNHYNKLLPTGNTSPAPRFYGLPKIHKANCPMRPIVSACSNSDLPISQIPHQNTTKVHRYYPLVCQRQQRFQSIFKVSIH